MILTVAMLGGSIVVLVVAVFAIWLADGPWSDDVCLMKQERTEILDNKVQGKGTNTLRILPAAAYVCDFDVFFKEDKAASHQQNGHDTFKHI